MEPKITLALTTRVGHERKVARELAVAGPRTIGATIETTVVCDGSKVRWPGLVLVTTPADVARTFLRGFPGVTGFAAEDPLRDEDLEALTRENVVQAVDSAELRVGRTYTVLTGPFSGLDATITAVEDERVAGEVIVFGRLTPVWFNHADLGAR